MAERPCFTGNLQPQQPHLPNTTEPNQTKLQSTWTAISAIRSCRTSPGAKSWIIPNATRYRVRLTVSLAQLLGDLVVESLSGAFLPRRLSLAIAWIIQGRVTSNPDPSGDSTCPSSTRPTRSGLQMKPIRLSLRFSREQPPIPWAVPKALQLR